MRPQISWLDLAGAKVGVWGLGIEGTANLERLLSLDASVVVVEDSPPTEPVLGCDVLALEPAGFSALSVCDFVVKAPGVRRRRPEVVALESNGIPVLGGLGLWLQEVDRDKVIAITGTKGKSTTTALTGHLLKKLGYDVLVAGNIGTVPYGAVARTDFDYAVIEVSSYQATDVGSSPPVIAVTSLSPDHLDWHGSVEAYFDDKLSLCTQPGAHLTVADGESPLLAERRSQLGPEVRWVTAEEPELGGPWLTALGLPGRHNRRNANISRATILAAGVAEAADDEKMAAAAAGYEGLESRLRPIAVVQGITFVDDSLSTNVLPTVAAVDAFAGRPIALVVGGHDRGIDYDPLGAALAGRHDLAPLAVFSLPENGPRITAAIRAVGGEAAPPTTDCRDMPSAVEAAFAWCVNFGNGVVLLSPAAPSFGHFRNYKDRADAFATVTRQLGSRQATTHLG